MRIRNFVLTVSGLLLFSAIPIAASVAMRYSRALISLDLVLIFLLLAAKKRLWSVALILVFVATESFYGFSQAYPLFNLRNAFEALRFLPYANPKLILLGVGALIAFTLVCFLAARMVSLGATRETVAGVLLIVGVGANFSTMTNFDPSLESRVHILNQPVFGSTDYELYYKWRAAGSEWGTANDGENFFPLKTWNTPSLIWPNGPKANKILFIVVESWGRPISDEEYKTELDSLIHNPGLRVLDQGTVTYSGGTVAAELRELCQIVPISYAFQTIPDKFSSRCLPKELASAGYKTIALHAAHAGMYARNLWYPAAGFQHSYFLNHPLAEVSRCHGFPGFCDIDLLPAVTKTLESESKIFFYWMTLNSHAPYDPGDLKAHQESYCKKLALAKGERCNQFLLIKDFFDGLGKALDKESLDGLEVVLVGDHKPPFFTGNYDNEFVKDKVPYIHLLVNGKLSPSEGKAGSLPH